MELLLAESLVVAVKTEAVTQRQLERVTVDTTVQSSQGTVAAVRPRKPRRTQWHTRPTAI